MEDSIIPKMMIPWETELEVLLWSLVGKPGFSWKLTNDLTQGRPGAWFTGFKTEPVDIMVDMASSQRLLRHRLQIYYIWLNECFCIFSLFLFSLISVDLPGCFLSPCSLLSGYWIITGSKDASSSDFTCVSYSVSSNFFFKASPATTTRDRYEESILSHLFSTSFCCFLCLVNSNRQANNNDSKTVSMEIAYQ